MPYQLFTTGPLKGLNLDENPHAVAQGELVVAENVARLRNMVGTRPGIERPGSGEDYETKLNNDTPASPRVIMGAAEYRQNFGTGRQLIVVADSASHGGAGGDTNIWYEDGETLPLATTADPQITHGTFATDVNNFWTFAIHNNTLYAAGGGDTDDLWYWDGVTGTGAEQLLLTDKNTGNNLRPKFIFEKWGYVFINGLRGGTSASNNPAVSRYADFATDPKLDTNWPDGNTVGFSAVTVGLNAFGASYSTGFAEYQDNEGDFLLMLGNNGIAAAKPDPGNDFNITDAISVGCVNQRAYANLGIDAGDGVFVSFHGIHSLRQSQEHGTKRDEFLSWKIQSLFDGLDRSRLPMTVAAYDRANGRVLFALSESSGSQGHDMIMCLDVKEKDSLTAKEARWYGPWRLQLGNDNQGTPKPIRITDLKFIQDENDKFHLYVFTTDGDVLRMTEETLSDLASNSYDVRMRTKHEPHGSILTAKQVGDVMTTLAPGGDYAISYRTVFDYGRSVSRSRNVNQVANPGFILGTGMLGVDALGTNFSLADRKIYATGRGSTVAHEFSHGGLNEPFYIGRIDYELDAADESIGEAV